MNSFSNETLDIKELPDYTQATFTPIAKSYIKVVIFNLIVFSVVILASAIALLYFLLKHESMLVKGLIFAAVCLFLILINVLSLIAFKRKSYAFREQDVMYRSGVLTISHEIIPYNRLQHVVLKQGWLSRSLGLATIHCYTAASSANEIAIPGLEKNHAEHIKDLLVNKINSIDLTEQQQNEPEAKLYNTDLTLKESSTNDSDLKNE